MLGDLVDIKIFVRVVATRSLSAAARELGLSLAVVSKRRAGLEKQLGVVLLRLSTRSQSLTVEGQAFYEAIGFTTTPQFTNEQAASMMWSDTIVVMLLTHDFWKTFTTKTIPNAKESAQMALAISFDSREEVDYIRWILEHGTGADRQLAVWEKSGRDLQAVVDYMILETSQGL
jgi:predicted lactoylglutathione lyase